MNWREFEFLAARENWPIAIAHRGGIAAGERTPLEELQRVISTGVRYIEIDVCATQRGELFVWHGQGVERIRPDRPFSVRRLAAESAVLFEDVVEGLPTDTRFFVDLKNQQAAEALADVVFRTASVGRVCVGSFSHDRTIRAAVAIAKRTGHWPCTALTPRQVLSLLTHSTLRTAWPASSASAQLPACLATSRIINTAHAAGALVFAWTVNDETAMRRLLSRGVDGLMTDELDRLKLVLEERGGSYAASKADSSRDCS